MLGHGANGTGGALLGAGVLLMHLNSLRILGL